MKVIKLPEDIVQALHGEQHVLGSPTPVIEINGFATIAQDFTCTVTPIGTFIACQLEEKDMRWLIENQGQFFLHIMDFPPIPVWRMIFGEPSEETNTSQENNS